MSRTHDAVGAMLAVVRAKPTCVVLSDIKGGSYTSSVLDLAATMARRFKLTQPAKDDEEYRVAHAALDKFSEAAEALGIRWWEVEP